MRRSFWLVIALLLTLLLPTPAFAARIGLWSKLSDLALGQERICKDGATFQVGATYYEELESESRNIEVIKVYIFRGRINGSFPEALVPDFTLEVPIPYSPVWLEGASDNNTGKFVTAAAAQLWAPLSVGSEITIYLSDEEPQNTGYTVEQHYTVENCAVTPLRTVGTGTPQSCTEAMLDAALADAHTLFFNCGADRTYADNRLMITLTSTKKITRDVTIYANNVIGLSGNNLIPIFHVNPGITLDLRYLTLTEGHSSGNGGAIQNNGGKINLAGIYFSYNFAAGSGGAIYSNGGSLSIRDSTFSANTSLTGDGGAIYSNGTLLSALERLEFIYNYAEAGRGGALYTPNNFTLTRGRFNQNVAKRGGAIYSSGNFRLAQSWFERNIADFGGAIYNAGGQVQAVFDDALPGSTASFVSNVAFTNGGAIYNQDGNVQVESASFHNNQSEYANGGAVYNTGANAKFDATFSSFSSNTAPLGSGGAIVNEMGKLNLSQSTLINNTAVANGGAVFNTGGQAVVVATTFNDNYGQYGSALANLNAAQTQFDRSTVANNTATGEGAIYNVQPGTVSLNFSTIADNNGDNFGGFYGEGIDVSYTLIARNFPRNCYQAITEKQRSLQFDPNILTPSTCGNALEFGTPAINILDNNGGLTNTIALGAAGAATNAILTTQCPLNLTDQRGLTRPQLAGCDIGAFEYSPASSINLPITSPIFTGDWTWKNYFTLDLNIFSLLPNAPTARGVNLRFTLPPNVNLINAVGVRSEVPYNVPCTLIFSNVTCYLGNIPSNDGPIIRLLLQPFDYPDINMFASVDMVDVNSASPEKVNNVQVMSNVDVDNGPGDPPFLDPGPQGPNAFPILTSVQIEGSQTRIRGTLHSAGNKTFTVDFYYVLFDCYANTIETIGTTHVTTDIYGDAQFNVLLPTAVEVNQAVVGHVSAPLANSSTGEGSCVQSVLAPSPANAAPALNLASTTHTPLLTWGVLSWAQGYEVQINSTSAFNGTYNYVAQTNVTQLITPFLNNGNYFWRVRGKINATQWGAWSTPQSLIVNTP